METFALLLLAALAFSILATVIEVRGARHARRRLLARSSPVLHPLPRHPLPRLRTSGSRRGLRLVALCLGFLAAAYISLVAVTMMHRLVARWF